MTRIARWAVVAVVVVTVVLEVVAYYHYRNAIDGVFVNVAILLYALFAVGLIWACDWTARRVRRRTSRAKH